MRGTILLALAVALTPVAGFAQNGAGDNGAPAAKTGSDKPKAPKEVPPPPPEALTKGKEIEPEVTIVKRQWATIEEYSVHGQVYAVKITPAWGPPYYLYDADGDGSLESRRDTLRYVPQTQQWKILTW